MPGGTRIVTEPVLASEPGLLLDPVLLSTRPACDVGTPDLPGSEVPAPVLPGSEVPGSEVPACEMPASEMPASEMPASEMPGSDVPAPEVAALDVMAQLALVLGAAEPGELSGVNSEQALQVIEAVEAVKAWADSVSIEATAAMVVELESDLAGLQSASPTKWERKRFRQSCRTTTAREIQVGTGLPITACQRLVWLACCESERVGATLEQMRLGRVDLARAMTLAEATAHLDADTAAAIAARVLRPLTSPSGAPLPGMAPLSQATFRARLHRQLILHDGLIGHAERTYDEALKARRLSGKPAGDGTAALVVTGDGPRLAAAEARVDTIARRIRKGGDPRTLAQLRADVATDLLMRGWIPDDPTFTTLGEPPAALVHLIVSLSTLLGLDRGTAQIPNWGHLRAQHARKLALQLGSIWKLVVTDPLTGRATEVSGGTYKVPAAMAEQVKTRDGTCRAPGCEIPTAHTDLDHTREWRPDGAGGPTAETNLAALHRGHHNLKTSGFWDSTQSADGSLTWTTATGRRLTTYPYAYDHPDNLPVKTSHLQAHLGRRLAAYINPDFPLPGAINVLDAIGWTRALAPATPKPPPHTWATSRANQNQRATTRAADAANDDYPPPF